MARSRSSVSISLLSLGALAVLAAGDPAPEPGTPEVEFDPARGAISVDFEDPFASGLVPELVVLTSGDARGETIPCG